jgi:hypothetical protein
MANRNFNRFQALEKEIKALYAEISFSALGAPTLVSGLGVAAVALDSGNIKITLQDKYMKLMHVSATVKGPTPSPVAIGVVSEDVDNAKTVVLSNTDELASCSLLVRIDVKNSSV